MRKMLSFILVIASILSAQERSYLTVAVASNMQFAMEKLRKEFFKRSGVEIRPVYGSSGKLAFQIRNGAPYDVFVSADTVFTDSIYSWGLSVGKPKVYAYGKLAMWTSKKDIDLSVGLSVLRDTRVLKIATADPLHAPYGRAAVQAMQSAKLYDDVKPKLVLAENVGQAAQYLLNQNAEIGFISKSQALEISGKGEGRWAEVDSASYAKIAQAAIICKYGNDGNPRVAAHFFRFLSGSGVSRGILKSSGYMVP
jgi:molybdate transport system substrate-binding protein